MSSLSEKAAATAPETGGNADGKLPRGYCASPTDYDKEAWKAAGNRFTPEELEAMRRTWKTAEIVGGPEVDYRVD